jgi:hypothetical protein
MPDGANKGSFLQGYNAQAAVDATAQVIVAAVTQETTDNRQLLPMLGRVEENLGRKPDAASADAGYWSEANTTNTRRFWSPATCPSTNGPKSSALSRSPALCWTSLPITCTSWR